MADAALRRLWEAVRRDFALARGMLPLQPAERGGRIARLDDWLDHNELELSLDELVSLGDDNDAPEAFWRVLLSAAERMGLIEHAARLKQRIA